nr:hypothetical protein [Tanacetum cinerariifolium]
MRTPRATLYEQNETPGGSIYWEPHVKGIPIPIEWAYYDTIDEALDMYTKYAKMAGFEIKKGGQRLTKSGGVQHKYIYCNKECVPKVHCNSQMASTTTLIIFSLIFALVFSGNLQPTAARHLLFFPGLPGFPIPSLPGLPVGFPPLPTLPPLTPSTGLPSFPPLPTLPPLTPSTGLPSFPPLPLVPTLPNFPFPTISTPSCPSTTTTPPFARIFSPPIRP